MSDSEGRAHAPCRFCGRRRRWPLHLCKRGPFFGDWTVTRGNR